MTSQTLQRQYRRKSTPNINWKGKFIPIINAILKELEAEGEKPSIRGVYYILVSRYKDEIPNTRSTYGSYDKATVKAREGGIIPEDAFTDDTRRIINIDDEFVTGEEHFHTLVDNLRDARQSYSIPRWYMQPKYVEFWVEKKAAIPMFKSTLLNGDVDREVRIVPNGGWTSRTYVQQNIVRIWNNLVEDNETSNVRHIYILYSGDFDPSGLKMDVLIKKELFGTIQKWLIEAVARNKNLPKEDHQKVVDQYLSHVHFERIAIRKPQIQEFNLEHLMNPEPETLAKLEGTSEKRGDPNTDWFKENHGDGEVYQIELDAMNARRQQFRTYLLSKVDGLFDNSIFEREVKDRLEEEHDIIIKLLDSKVKFVDDGDPFQT